MKCKECGKMYFTVQEAADFLNVTDNTIRGWVKKGLLSQDTLISKTDLLNFKQPGRGRKKADPVLDLIPKEDL